MTDLLTRLEQATEGSRELDEDISRHLGWKHQGANVWRPPNGCDQALAPFTRSIDAALTLVPEGWIPCSLKWYPDHVWAHLEALGKLSEGSAATPALALCIACLRAHEHGEGS